MFNFPVAIVPWQVGSGKLAIASWPLQVVSFYFWQQNFSSQHALGFLTGTSTNYFHFTCISSEELTWEWECSRTSTRITAHKSKVTPIKIKLTVHTSKALGLEERPQLNVLWRKNALFPFPNPLEM